MANETTPTVEEVANWLRARTYDSDGNLVGTFTDDGRTIPSATEVTGIINQAVEEVLSPIGGVPCNENLVGRAKGLTALYAAMVVELSYFPEQVGSNRSPYDRLERLYNSGLGSLVTDVADQCGGQGEGGAGDGEVAPAYNFEQYVDPIGKDGPSW